MEEQTNSLPTLKCLRCLHEWHPRTTKMPARCPKCNSPYWNKPRRKGDINLAEEVAKERGSIIYVKKEEK